MANAVHELHLTLRPRSSGTTRFMYVNVVGILSEFERRMFHFVMITLLSALLLLPDCSCITSKISFGFYFLWWLPFKLAAQIQQLRDM